MKEEDSGEMHVKTDGEVGESFKIFGGSETRMCNVTTVVQFWLKMEL